MRTEFIYRCLLVAAIIGSGASAHAQVLTARRTVLNYNYVYGAGGDSHTGDDRVEETALQASDSDHLEFGGCTEGVLPNGQHYTACASTELDYSFSFVGPLDNFHSMTGSGRTEVAASTTGAGISVMYASNPGNEMLAEFSVPADGRFRLVGSIVHPDPGAFNYVSLQRFDGFTWQWFYTTIFLPGGNGPFDVTGPMPAGQYRMASAVSLRAFGNEAFTASFDYVLTLTRPADMNCDLMVDGDDIQGFVEALLTPATYVAHYPDCRIGNADITSDGEVTADDVAPFITCVLNGGCPN